MIKSISIWRNQFSLKKIYGNLAEEHQQRNTCVSSTYGHLTNKCIKGLDSANLCNLLMEINLCFSCISAGHVASKCKSRSYFKFGYKQKASTSIHSILSSGEMTYKKETTKSNLTKFNWPIRGLHSKLTAIVNYDRVRTLVDAGWSNFYICRNNELTEN